MQNTNDGGAAFPATHPTHSGMSLLDYFAGQALLIESFSGLDPRQSVKRAYDVAELMLEEKNYRANSNI